MENIFLKTTREKGNWFNDWFNSPYYHILYKNRDFKEAEAFIEKLYAYGGFNYSHKIADVGCGKGRHAIYLNSKGCDVTGLDLSPKNISFANGFANERLQFFVHDMRDNFAKGTYDYVLNLFTSFGYFEEEWDNISTLKSFQQAIRPGGKIIIDFMNTPKIMNQLMPAEIKTVDGITFEINKEEEGGFIKKYISFHDREKKFSFIEKVKVIHLSDFNKYFELAGLKIKDIFGDYQLHPYSEENSERMIFILENPL
jgi:SAM-dependent methyltransferase